jgi:N-acetyl-gamma-glutamyl-phosphate reductase
MQHRSGLNRAPLFAPSVVPAFRGMIVEVPLHLDRDGGAGALRDCLANHYAGSPIVRVQAEAGAIDELLLRADMPASDAMTLFVLANRDGRQARLIAMLDNLGKGASGACVQNLNLMAGLPETVGLRV